MLLSSPTQELGKVRLKIVATPTSEVSFQHLQKQKRVLREAEVVLIQIYRQDWGGSYGALRLKPPLKELHPNQKVSDEANSCRNIAANGDRTKVAPRIKISCILG